MTEHEQTMQLVQQVQQLLAELPGKLVDHQQRINSMKFIAERLDLLNKLESAHTQVEVPSEE